MSCSVFQKSNEMLRKLLATEKDFTRVWLRAEMDRLVDPMLDSIFNRLQTKLTNGLKRTQSGDGDDCEQVVNHDNQLCPSPNQLHQSSFVIAQPSTSSHLIPPHQNVHYSHQQPNDNPIFCNDNSNQQFEMSYLVQPTIPPNVQVNSEALSNEQSNQNFDDDDAGECYCDKCLGAIEIDDEVEDDDDDSDSVQCIEDEQEDGESSRHVKRPRMELTHPNNATQPELAGQFPRQATSEAQANQVTKQFITVHLQCPLFGCPDTLPEGQLNQHMLEKHLLGPSRCLVKDCGQSFNNNVILGQHLKHSHQHTSQWQSDKCPKYFATYKKMSNHSIEYHHLGHFQCSFPSCTFTGKYKRKMFRHYSQQHKPKFVCSQTDCNYRTHKEATLKAHERAHLGIKPYRCKWLNCHYSSSYQHHVLSHIRTQHLTSRFQSPNQMDVVAQSADPRDYLEVASELL